MTTEKDSRTPVKTNDSPASGQGAPSTPPDAAGQTTGPSAPTSDQETADQRRSRPYGMIVALAALILMSLVAFAAMLMFRDVFENATDVSTVLASLFAVVGTVVGAYFGIKTSGDARDKMQETIESTNRMRDSMQGIIDREKERSTRALAQLDSETRERILKDTDGSV